MHVQGADIPGRGCAAAAGTPPPQYRRAPVLASWHLHFDLGETGEIGRWIAAQEPSRLFRIDGRGADRILAKVPGRLGFAIYHLGIARHPVGESGDPGLPSIGMVEGHCGQAEGGGCHERIVESWA